eukprot:800718-Pelagomonas_calceolata.AAC.1
MAQALRHAIYSAILNTEATATLMFLPVWGQHMKTEKKRKKRKNYVGSEHSLHQSRKGGHISAQTV